MTDNHLVSIARTSQPKPRISLHWDCQNVPIKNPFLARYLSVFASQRGNVVGSKAYANWRAEKCDYELHLYDLGYDCMDVPRKAKNSVDQKIIADLIRDMELGVSSDIYIFVTGDGDFADLVRQLKAKGKKVIIFAQSSNVSQRLIQLADECYFVDKLPELTPENIQHKTTSVQGHIAYNEAIDYMSKAIKTALSKGRRTVLACIDSLMRQLFPQYKGVSSICTPDGKKFPSFSKFVEAAVKDGKVRMQNQELFLIEAEKQAI